MTLWETLNSQLPQFALVTLKLPYISSIMSSIHRKHNSFDTIDIEQNEINRKCLNCLRIYVHFYKTGQGFCT